MFDIIICALKEIINFLVWLLFDWWILGIAWVLDQLPDADFSAKPIEWGNFGNAIGYFIPVSDMINHFSLLIVALTVYFGVQHVLRLLKAVR